MKHSLSDKCGLLWLNNCTKYVYAGIPAFLLGGWISVHAGQRFLHDQYLIKTLGTMWPVPNNSTSLLENLNASCVTLLGNDAWKFAPSFLQTLLHMPFPLLICISFVSFPVVNFSSEFDYMLIPVSFCSELLNMGWYCGHPQHNKENVFTEEVQYLPVWNGDTACSTKTVIVFLCPLSLKNKSKKAGM